MQAHWHPFNGNDCIQCRLTNRNGSVEEKKSLREMHFRKFYAKKKIECSIEWIRLKFKKTE